MRVKIFLVIVVFAASPLAAQQSFEAKLSDAAIALTHQPVIYDPAYFSIDYPNGDVPANKGVCTDVIIRAYRKVGIDLQKEVHEDMKHDFESYPQLWGLRKTDANIDHRRVPNLMFYFEKHGQVKPITDNPSDYAPGDIVAWNLGGNTLHIGLVINKKSEDGKRNLIVHNIGNGEEISDCLFTYRIIGHYTYRK